MQLGGAGVTQGAILIEEDASPHKHGQDSEPPAGRVKNEVLLNGPGCCCTFRSARNCCSWEDRIRCFGGPASQHTLASTFEGQILALRVLCRENRYPDCRPDFKGFSISGHASVACKRGYPNSPDHAPTSKASAFLGILRLHARGATPTPRITLNSKP